MKNLKFSRYFLGLYKRDYNHILFFRIQRFYNISLEETLKIILKRIKKNNHKEFIRGLNNNFNLSLNYIDTNYNFKSYRNIKTLKSLPIPEELYHEYQKLRCEKIINTKIKRNPDDPHNTKKMLKTKEVKYGDISEYYRNLSLKSIEKTDYNLRNIKIKETLKRRYGVESNNYLKARNMGNYNESFIRENFIKDGYFYVDEFVDYFNLFRDNRDKVRHRFNIREPNKNNKHKTQSYIFECINTNKKILNDRSILKPLELDIFLPDYRLAVEYNGLLFHSFGTSSCNMINNTEIDRYIHYKKFKMCEDLEITLLNIFEEENINIWLKNIHRFFNFEEHKIEIEEFNEAESIEFLRKYSIDFKYTKDLKFLGFKLNNEIENLIAFKNNFIYYIESKNNFNINFIEYVNTNFKGFYFKDNLRNSLRRFFNFEFIKRYKPNCYLIENFNLIMLFKIPEVSEKRFTFDCGFDVLRLKD